MVLALLWIGTACSSAESDAPRAAVRDSAGVRIVEYAGDPVATLAVVVVVLTATVLAAWLPARRAMRIDPVRALSSD